MTGDVRILSISIDEDIANSDSEAFARQREYAEHFERYTVITKTGSGLSEGIHDGPLEVLPTSSRNRYQYPFDVLRLGTTSVSRRGFDVVTAQDPFALGTLAYLLSRWHDARLHTQVHVDFAFNDAWRSESPRRRLTEPAGRTILRQSDAVRVGTDHERQKLELFLPDDIDIHVAPVRMDFDEVVREVPESERTALRERLDLGNSPVVLFNGRFVKQKRLDRWLETAATVRRRTGAEPRFVVVGAGPLSDEIRTKAAGLGLTDALRFPGWVPFEELATYYSIASVYLITSGYEGTARVVVEAGMNELPVVATPFAGAIDNIQEGTTGFIESEVAALADRVAWLLENPAEARQMGAVARSQLADRFDPNRLVSEYVDFLGGKPDYGESDTDEEW